MGVTADCEQVVSGFQVIEKPEITKIWEEPKQRVKRQLSEPLTCLGDGHDGIWNIYQEIDSVSQRREILDWFHLVENWVE